ncbi:gamma carbonic anhydrase family protein [Sporolactobacillus sp. THM7-4]|nr:gamma carbonic anhydrase family protein [Sporolactobacillus sp. THM7-4]
MYPYKDFTPKIDPSAFVAPGAQIIGQVELAAESSVWFNAVLRGDEAGIYIGEGSNIQDGTVIHVDKDKPVFVGRHVTVGHSVTLHGCTIEDGALIGMGATILNGAVVRKGALVAAGALVLENQVIEAGMLAAGVPAKIRRKLTEENAAYLIYDAKHYIAQSRQYMKSGVQQNQNLSGKK